MHVARDDVEYSRLEHEEASIDPTRADLRLLGEALDTIALELELAKTGGRTYRGHRGQLPVSAVKGKQLAEIDVGDAVTVGEHEAAVAQQGRYPGQPSAGLGSRASKSRA